MRRLLIDLRHAWRSLAATRGFTIAAVTTLGLAIALCTTVFAVVKAYLLTELPYPAADRLYSIRYSAPGEDQPRNMERLDWASLAATIEQPIAWDLDMFYVLGGDNAEQVPGAWVTPGFIQGLGIRPSFGRGFEAASFQPGSANVALISHRLWKGRFGADPGVLGRQFSAYVSDRPNEAERFTIIGVLPEEFWHINSYTDILAPLRVPTYPYMVRLREGVTPQEAAAAITSLVRAGASGVPVNWAATVDPVRELYVRRLRPVLRTISVAAALVLLVGCANVAGLLLVRATRRQHEIAVRVALGATRAAVAQLLLTEAFVLGAAATILGVGVTRLVLTSLAPLVERQLGRSAPGGMPSFSADGLVLAGASAAGMLTILICAAVPLATLLRRRITLRSRTSTEGRGTRRLRSALIAFEIAASLALLIGSMLMLRTVISLVHVDLGIESERMLAAPVTLRLARYPDPQTRFAMFERVLAELRELPGVQSVALTAAWPLQQPQPDTVEALASADRTRAAVHPVSDSYFVTFGIPVRVGREITRQDRPGSEPVAVISESLARRLWPDGGAVGRQLAIPDDSQGTEGRFLSRRVVGVVADVRQDPADTDLADAYVPFLQMPGRFAVVLVRTSGRAATWTAAVRSAFHRIDPEISIARTRPLQQDVDERRARPRFIALLLGVLAGIAAFVAVLGVYGMIAYAVRQREREIAIRMAIGADAARITRLFMWQGATVLGAGITMGIAAAVVSGRLLESQLFGVGAKDPVSIALSAAGFGLAGMFAIWWPSRRAAAADPSVALRAE